MTYDSETRSWRIGNLPGAWLFKDPAYPGWICRRICIWPDGTRLPYGRQHVGPIARTREEAIYRVDAELRWGTPTQPGEWVALFPLKTYAKRLREAIPEAQLSLLG